MVTIQKVTVRVPASVSNLGPGFDCLGVALRLYNSLTVTRTDKQHALPPVLDQAAKFFFKRLRVRRFPIACTVDERVPRARGLGSSATVRLGLLHALNQHAGNPLDRAALFQFCAELEGHPDNAAPASFGGFTVARRDVVQRFDVSPRLKFVVLIPDHEVKTSDARKILPQQIGRIGAVESCGNACTITAGFASGNYGILPGNFSDHLHQPFRSKLVPYLSRVITAAERAGALGAFLSGSGSSIAAVTVETPEKIARAMVRALGERSGRSLIVSADNHGVALIKHKA
jgi:homoserine kinase